MFWESVLLHLCVLLKLPSSVHVRLGRYSTFQYPDQDAYQYAYPEDFNADALFHVSVSVKRICLFLHYF